MKREMICIECPKGCRLTVEADGGKFIGVSGNKCPRGADYARAETEAPVRTLTTTVLTKGLELPMLPVRTSRPIPGERISEAMAAIRRLTVTSPVKAGAVIAENFLGLGADLVATRRLEKL